MTRRATDRRSRKGGRCELCGDRMTRPMPEGWLCRHCQRSYGEPGTDGDGGLDAYVFQAALLCEECAADVRQDVPFPDGADPQDESSWDSDEWPKGPYPDGGGESDSPQHCDRCGLFLRNPLTAEGEEYVQEAVAEHARTGHGACAAEWARYYGIQCPQPAAGGTA